MAQEITTEQQIAKGREAYAQGKYAAAAVELREALEREPRFADVHHLLGLCLSLMGRPAEAIGSFDSAVAINPRYVEALVNRALTLLELGRYDEARASFEAASEADLEAGVGRFSSVMATRLAHRHAELGDLYREGGAVAEALGEYRRAVELRPRFVDIRNKLARALLDLGQHDEAVGELAKLLELNPNFVAARINLGLAWYRMGDFAAARREWERCHHQRPGDGQVAAYLRMLSEAE